MKSSFCTAARATFIACALTLLAPNAHSFTIDTSSSAASSMTGLWNNATEAGWGTAVIQQFGMMFVTMYSYDASGTPVWYVASACAVSADRCSGPLYRVTGGRAPTVAWNAPSTVVAQVGTLTMTFADLNNATMAFTIDGSSGSKVVSRYVFALAPTPASFGAPPSPMFSIDTSSTSTSPLTGLWNNASETGWGAAVIQQFGMMFVTMYTYDASGNAVWYVASACAVSASQCSGPLYKVNGGLPPTVAWNAPRTVVTQVGTLTISFSDLNTATMAFTINGASGSKTLSRYVFALAPP